MVVCVVVLHGKQAKQHTSLKIASPKGRHAEPALSTLATYSNYPLCRLLPPLRRHHRLHAPSDSKSWNRSSETHLHHQIIKQSHNTAPNTTTNHLITISYLMSMILNLIFHSFSTLPLTISSSCSSTPPSFQPLKSPFATPTYRQHRRRKQQHR